MKNSEKIILEQFDSLVSKVFRDEKKYYGRNKGKYNERNIMFSDLPKNKMQMLYAEDEYFKDEKVAKMSVAEFDADITNELLYEAMKRLKQKSQNVIILKYWYEMTDDEIGKILNLKRTTVNYNKNAALRKLKIIIEEMIENDEWFEF